MRLRFRNKTLPRVRTFYCRVNNQTVGACPRAVGAGECPLRQECQAYAMMAPDHRAAQIAATA
jgi:hypothetical protein